MRTNLIMDLLVRGLGLLRLFITPLVLSTTEYGELGLISAIFLYANFADLGLQIHYEVISTMDPAHIQHELIQLLRKLSLRLLFSSTILAGIIYIETKSLTTAFACIFFVFTLNIDTLFQIIMRQQQLYKRLALALFIQAFVLTLLIAPAAYYLRINGVLFLQALTPLLSIAVGFHAVKELKQKHAVNLSSERHSYDNRMTAFLLVGQIQMMIWITADRFFLSRVLSLSDLGLWNLGNMAAALLLGYANTYGTLKLPLWKKEKGTILTKKFLLSLIGIYFTGLIALSIAVKTLLQKYNAGLVWNSLWLTVMLFIGVIFVLDAHQRSQMKTSGDARNWAVKKMIAQSIGAIFLFAGLKLSSIDPRILLMMAMMISFICITGLSQKRIREYV